MASEEVQFPENKWTIHDKLTQLRNVMKLQDRAANQNKNQAIARCKYQVKEIKNMSKDNEKLRKTLDVNIRGCDLRRRTTMRNNRRYQLAFQRLPTNIIVERMSESLFSKIKEKDRLLYKRRQMENTLLVLKIQLHGLKGAKKYVMKMWREQEVSNKLHNMYAKQNSALTIKIAYEKMIKILKEDAQNFDKTLANLKEDRMIQSKCILQATEMGQKAVEDLANLRDQYKIEEKNILTLMKKMDVTAKTIKHELERVSASCRTVIRTESLTRFGSIQTEDEEGRDDTDAVLVKDLNELEEALERLKSVTEVLTFDDIFPRIQQQVQQKVRLLKQLEQKENLRDSLLDQRNQLESLLESLEHTMVSTTDWYRSEKGRLLEETSTLDNDRHLAVKTREKIGALLLCIRLGLLSLSRKLDRISTSSKYDLLQGALDDDTLEGVLMTLPQPETDALEILGNVNRKMEMLVHQIRNIDLVLTHEIYLRGRRMFETKIISKNVIEHKEDEYELAMTEMLEELGTIDDPLVPTRLDIKNRSARVIEIFGTQRHPTEPKTKSRFMKAKRR